MSLRQAVSSRAAAIAGAIVLVGGALALLGVSLGGGAPASADAGQRGGSATARNVAVERHG